MTADVATPNAASMAMAQDWTLIHDLMGGTRAMRSAGEKWLPREPGESPEAYRIRLGRTYLFNGFGPRGGFFLFRGGDFPSPNILRQPI